ncbi:MAG: molybdenum cofactor guanylyltransferase [Myxococcota bacterium]|nr:molybdenum cofactor guanylyltransferase [Myxococcota bacterium]MDW8361994.1 molybdenum cofactor guanylyltransferase [Myxococcales bacterium]
MTPARTALAILVGGKSRRMGGHPKGLLAAPGSSETLLERLVREGRRAELTPWLVGRADAYAEQLPGVPRVPDAAAPCGGPCAGLLGALQRAADDGLEAIVLAACDMPYMDATWLRRVAWVAGNPVAVAPREPAARRWQPFPSRWSVGALPTVRRAVFEGLHDMQRLLDAVGATALEVSPEELARLRDWDEPADVERDTRPSTPGDDRSADRAETAIETET